MDAASISTTSSAVWPPQIRVQDSHSPQGSPSSVRSGQLRAIAKTRASVVFPTPRGPQNRYACPTRLFATACRNVSETCSCVATSEKARGLCLRAKALWLNVLCYPYKVNCYCQVPQATRSDNHRTYRCYLRGPGGVRSALALRTWGTWRSYLGPIGRSTHRYNFFTLGIYTRPY